MRNPFHRLVRSGLILIVSAASLPADEEFAPKVYDAERYREIWEKSPFVAVVAQTPSSEGLAQRFALTGTATLEDRPVIFVLDRKDLTRQVVTEEPNPEGIVLVSVQDPSDFKSAQATIKLGAEQAVIRYDLAAMQNVNQNPQPGPVPNMTTGPAVRTSPGSVPTPPPRRTRVIRRPRPINLNK